MPQHQKQNNLLVDSRYEGDDGKDNDKESMAKELSQHHIREVIVQQTLHDKH